MAERRLAAIMYVDMVGFTQLSQRNEQQALAFLDEYRRILRPVFSAHNGREVKTIGDGFLVEFGSALEAVRSAYEIQRALHDRNSSQPEEQRIVARVGVHIGDVVRDQNDIQGDAVNIASRIEPLAEAGGICVSQPVHVQVANKFEFPMVSIGVKPLKNVYTPMEVFRVILPWEKGTVIEPTALPRTRIAVLPFSNISPDQNDEYFADGMTEELINTISHNRQLKVIARTTVGKYKGTPKTIHEIGKEIGAGTILEGSVRKAGNKIRVTAQLIDAASEDHIWSDNYDRQLEDIFTIQSEIARSVSDALMAKLLPNEKAEVERKATKSPAAYVRSLKGRILLRDRTEKGLWEAKRLFEEAIAEDHSYAEAYAGLADAYFLLGNYNHMPTTEANTKGREALKHALELNDELAEAHNTLAQFLTIDYRFDEAEREFKRAISINPNYSLAHHWYAICLLEMGDLPKSMEEHKMAQDLDPLSPAIAANLAYGYAIEGNRTMSDEQLKKMKELDTSRLFTNYITAIVMEYRGDIKAAIGLMEEAVRNQPNNPELPPLLGYYAGMSGDVARAEEIIAMIERLPEGTERKPFYLSSVYMGLRRWDEMFAQLNLAFDERSLLFRVIRYSSMSQELKKDPRYTALLQRANLRQ